jgi:AraC-like DNA-binding protein
MIGKTRQKPPKAKAPKVEEIYDPEVGKGRGMLRRPLSEGKMRHVRRSPAADLSTWIAHYWMIQWDLRGCEPHIAESLPHPNVHVIFEPRASVVCGVHTSKFSRLLEGQSQVFGVKFKPGAFRPFFKSQVSKLANRLVPVKSVFGKEVEGLQTIVLSSRGEDERVEAANAFFRARMPKSDKTVDLVARLVQQILDDRDIKTVEDLAAKTSTGKRSLQRLFNEYAGVSPKWVIQRYRLHEAIEQAHSKKKLDWSQLALDLGYFDQAHLINDFRALTGYSPTEYQALTTNAEEKKLARNVTVKHGNER